jgi:hypothetical protein
VAGGFFSSDGKTMALVRNDGAIYEMNTVTEKFSPSTVSADCSEWPIANSDWPLSSDGAKLYVGYGGVASDGMSAGTELRVLDTATRIGSGAFRPVFRSGALQSVRIVSRFMRSSPSIIAS